MFNKEIKQTIFEEPSHLYCLDLSNKANTRKFPSAHRTRFFCFLLANKKETACKIAHYNQCHVQGSSISSVQIALRASERESACGEWSIGNKRFQYVQCQYSPWRCSSLIFILSFATLTSAKNDKWTIIMSYTSWLPSNRMPLDLLTFVATQKMRIYLHTTLSLSSMGYATRVCRLQRCYVCVPAFIDIISHLLSLLVSLLFHQFFIIHNLKPFINSLSLVFR